MTFFTALGAARRGLLPGLLLAALTARAQSGAPAWTLAVPAALPTGGGYSNARAVAADASGNVFVAGYFAGQVAFGSTTLTSAGGRDLFVAKYVPATGTWAWALRGGGVGTDEAGSIAVSGSSIYVGGGFENSLANTAQVTLGGSTGAGGAVQLGASPIKSPDILLAKFTDQGSSATFNWSQAVGGTDQDYGGALAVSGSSVYLTGTVYNDAANHNQVLLGGSGPTPGTVALAGSGTQPNNDLVLAKYQDDGSSSTLVWTQAGGGGRSDGGCAVAVSGSRVYLAATLTNDNANQSRVLLGGSGLTPGTVPVRGASLQISPDLLLARYTDQGASAVLDWTQVAGGTDADYPTALAVSGSSLYVLGTITNNLADSRGVVLGSGATPGAGRQVGASSQISADLVLARYTDQGSGAGFDWSQVGGGTGSDYSGALAVRGTSVYVVGSVLTSATNAGGVVFGGGGATPGTVPVSGRSIQLSHNLLVARYADQGSRAALAWTQVAGGDGVGDAFGNGLAVAAAGLFLAGIAPTPVAFGALLLSDPAGAAGLGVLAGLGPAALPTRAAGSPAGAGLSLYPNPAGGGAATLSGAPAGAAVQVLDALGRRVATATADAAGMARLAGLAPGLYLVRAGGAAIRLAVE